MTYHFKVSGQVPSKSNLYRIVTINGHGALAKTSASKAYEQAFFLQCPVRDLGLKERFRLDIDVYYASDRPDLDNSLKAILDCLQACKAIDNDRHCVEIHARKLVDKTAPRCEITITTYGTE